jgi:hypothetical protein
VPKQIAEWNTDLKLWGNSETDLLSERWEPFLETWPISGTMRNGKVYELQTQEHHTSVLESLLLPTLKARDSQAEGYEAGLRRATPQVGTIVKGIVDGDKRITLPTPRAQNGEDRNNKIWHADASKPQNLENALAHVIFDIPDSSLLRSPTASQGQGGALGEAEARKRGNTVGIRDQAMDLAKLQGFKVSREADNLLPTPIVRDYKDGQSDVLREGKVQTDTIARAIFSSGEILLGTPRTSPANGSTSKQVETGAPKSRIEDQVKLLPTLRASDSYERRNQKTMDRIARDGGDMTMTTLARTTTDWGKFEPAIRRWEAIIGRPAPEPTKPDGKDGNHRLSSKFTEWMMGLPDNWITGHDLKRNDELKLAGNGVVPQQAELALRLLLDNHEE